MLVAEAIHYLSNRNSRELFTINCSALTETLIESELFGHKRGSFTGAVADYEGKLRAANGGTVFLDEIGDMAMSAQAKMLRAVENRKIIPVGGSRSYNFSARIIAATNKDLREEIRRGRFREDLFYRIHRIPIHVPLLSKRLDDLPTLALELYKKHSANLPGYDPNTDGVLRINPKALEILKQHKWYGNVRELDGMMERLAIYNSGKSVVLDSASVHWLMPTDILPEVSTSDTTSRSDKGSFRSRVDLYEKSLIMEALVRTDYNLVQAARDLGLPYNTLKHNMRTSRITNIRTGHTYRKSS